MPGRHPSAHAFDLHTSWWTRIRAENNRDHYGHHGILERILHFGLLGEGSEPIRSEVGIHWGVQGDVACFSGVYLAQRVGSEGWRACRRVCVDRTCNSAFLR